MQSLLKDNTRQIKPAYATRTTAIERRTCCSAGSAYLLRGVADSWKVRSASTGRYVPEIDRRCQQNNPFVATIALLLTTACTSLLTSCTTVAPVSTPTQETWQTRKTQLERIQSWQLNGKVGVQTAQDSGSANVSWQENRGSYTVSLYAPLGAGAMKLTGRPGQATLTTSDGKKFTASSPEALLAKNWGFNLPVSYLRYWVRGLPVPGPASKMTFDSFNRVTSLTQQGWRVEIQSYTRAGNAELPSQLSISSPSLHGKLVIHEWSI